MSSPLEAYILKSHDDDDAFSQGGGGARERTERHTDTLTQKHREIDVDTEKVSAKGVRESGFTERGPSQSGVSRAQNEARGVGGVLRVKTGGEGLDEMSRSELLALQRSVALTLSTRVLL